MFSGSAFRSNNFIIGLTNTSTEVQRPNLNNYVSCGQYPGAVPAGATVNLNCTDASPPARYVIVQFPGTEYMNFWELNVCAEGRPITLLYLYLSFRTTYTYRL